MVDKAKNRKKRKIKRTTNVTDHQEIAINTYNEISGASKHLIVGGRWIPRGALAAAKSTFGSGNGKVIQIYNPTGADIFFLSGDSSLAAPTNAANGYPILAGEIVEYALGDHTHMAASAAGMFFYELDDDTQLVNVNTAN